MFVGSETRTHSLVEPYYRVEPIQLRIWERRDAHFDADVCEQRSVDGDDGCRLDTGHRYPGGYIPDCMGKAGTLLRLRAHCERRQGPPAQRVWRIKS